MFIEKPIATGPAHEINDAFAIAKIISDSKTVCSVGWVFIPSVPSDWMFTRSQVYATIPESCSDDETHHRREQSHCHVNYRALRLRVRGYC